MSSETMGYVAAAAAALAGVVLAVYGVLRIPRPGPPPEESD